MEVQTWVELVVQGGAMGGLLLFLWMFFTKVLPDFRDDANQARTQFISAIEKKSEESRRSSAEARTDFIQALEKRDEKFDEALDRMTKDGRAAHEAMAKKVEEQTQVLREGQRLRSSRDQIEDRRSHVPWDETTTMREVR